MWHWIVFTALILLVPSYFGLLHARELLRAFRAGELRCPVRPERRGKLGFAE